MWLPHRYQMHNFNHRFASLKPPIGVHSLCQRTLSGVTHAYVCVGVILQCMNRVI